MLGLIAMVLDVMMARCGDDVEDYYSGNETAMSRNRSWTAVLTGGGRGASG